MFGRFQEMRSLADDITGAAVDYNCTRTLTLNFKPVERVFNSNLPTEEKLTILLLDLSKYVEGTPSFAMLIGNEADSVRYVEILTELLGAAFTTTPQVLQHLQAKNSHNNNNVLLSLSENMSKDSLLPTKIFKLFEILMLYGVKQDDLNNLIKSKNYLGYDIDYYAQHFAGNKQTYNDRLESCSYKQFERRGYRF